jgi:mannose-6-phosphate isomerase-like protein (cupin superfamily)
MEEIYFIMSGEGEMHVDDESRKVTPGDAIWIPAGSSHALANTGESLLFILVVASPNW